MQKGEVLGQTSEGAPWGALWGGHLESSASLKRTEEVTWDGKVPWDGLGKQERAELEHCGKAVDVDH